MRRFERQPVADEAEAVVRIPGELDIAAAHQIENLLRAADETGAARVVVDLADATFVDCRIVALLVEAAGRTSTPGRSFAVIGATGTVQRVIALLAPAILADTPAEVPTSRLALVAA